KRLGASEATAGDGRERRGAVGSALRRLHHGAGASALGDAGDTSRRPLPAHARSLASDGPRTAGMARVTRAGPSRHPAARAGPPGTRRRLVGSTAGIGADPLLLPPPLVVAAEPDRARAGTAVR